MSLLSGRTTKHIHYCCAVENGMDILFNNKETNTYPLSYIKLNRTSKKRPTQGHVFENDRIPKKEKNINAVPFLITPTACRHWSRPPTDSRTCTFCDCVETELHVSTDWHCCEYLKVEFFKGLFFLPLTKTL